MANCRRLGDLSLSADDQKKLQQIYPGFCYTRLSRYVRLSYIHKLDILNKEDLVLMKSTKYNNIISTLEPFMSFFISNN